MLSRSRAPKRIVNKMDRILPALARLIRNKTWDMSGVLHDVLGMFIEFEQAKRTNSAIKTVHDYLTKYMSLAPAKGKGNPVAEDWMRIIDKASAKSIADGLHEYADSMPKDTANDYGDSSGLPGMGLDGIKDKARDNELQGQAEAFSKITKELVGSLKGQTIQTGQHPTLFSRREGKRPKGMKKKFVEVAVAKLQKAAKRALSLEVVQSFSDLPQNIQDEFNASGSGILEDRKSVV